MAVARTGRSAHGRSTGWAITSGATGWISTAAAGGVATATWGPVPATAWGHTAGRHTAGRSITAWRRTVASSLSDDGVLPFLLHH